MVWAARETKSNYTATLDIQPSTNNLSERIR